MSVDPATVPVIVAARRTPIGTTGGHLRGVDLIGLAAEVLRACATDAGFADGDPDDVVLGNVMGPGGNPARVAALAAGLGNGIPGVTVDRQCASGLEAINLAATMIRAGRGTAYLAGGAESPSTAPWRAFRPRSAGEPPRFYQRAPFAPAEIGDPDMGPAADAVSREAGVSRQRQDEYAAASHRRALAARRAGRFTGEIVPVGGVSADQRPRAGLTEARLARLRPAFVPGGTVTAGNSSGVNDGAAAVALVSEHRAAGRPGLRVLDWETAGVDPNRPGLGPVPAVRALLGRAGLSVSDIDVIEFTEAFAGQVLACLDALNIPVPKVCPDGGAIALGHPWGASGAVLMVRLFTRLVRHAGGRYGLAAIASGGGQGVATLVERIE